jgi:hypothetical protein
LLLLAAVHVYWPRRQGWESRRRPNGGGTRELSAVRAGTAMVAAGLCLIVAILALRIGWLKLPVIAGDNILFR